MKVLLISANTETINMPVFPLGLASVAQAVIDAGHRTAWLDLMGKSDIRTVIEREISSFSPDLIGISVRNVDDQNMLNPGFLLSIVKGVVRICKEVSNVPVLIGGSGYSIFPESSLDYLKADMGIQGEGENVVPELFDCIENDRSFSEIAGLYIRGRGLQSERKFEKNLDNFPFPDPALFPTSVYEGENFYVPIQTRRGCPLACSYCSTGTVEGRVIRSRSVDSVIQWINKWVERDFRRFQFVDNNFNIPPDYAKELCRKIREANLDIKWRSIIYPGRLDESLIKSMATAGCNEVSLGFESGCDDILAGMNKHFSAKDVVNSAKMLIDNNIKVMGFLLLGGPGETKETALRSLDFIEGLNLNSLRITTGIRIYPNTKLMETALEHDMIKENDDLLFPRFYMAEKIQDWLVDTVRERAKKHTNWIM